MVDKVSKSDLIKIAKSKGYSEAQIQKMSYDELNALISNTKVKTEGTVYKGLDGLDSKSTNNTSFTGNIWTLKGNTTGGKDPFAIEKQNQPIQTHSTKTKVDSPKSIADNLFNLADKYSGAVSQKSFQDQLNKINKDNVLDVLNEYEKKSPSESLIEMICNEKGSSSAERQAAIAKVFGEVAKKAKENGVDVQHFQSEFNAESNYQFKKIGFTDASKMNTILNAVVVATKNKASLTPQERKAINSTNSAEQAKQTTGILQHRAKSAQTSFDHQMKEDGWAGDVADFTSGLWSSKNRAKFVREDITKFNGQIKQLQLAETKGSNAYKEKFYETFGVEYDADNIAIYKKKEQQNQAAIAVYGVENNFNSTNNKLLKNPKLQEETYTTTAPTFAGAITTTSVSATKEQVYNRELNNFAQFIGQGDVKNGKAQLEAYMKSKGLDLNKATIDQKYIVMHDRAVSYSKELHKNTMTVTESKGMAAFTKEYEASYNAAFGIKNDIAKRVTDYNNSQQAGAAIVKNGVIMAGSIAAGVLTGGAGLTLFPAIMATGASAAAVTAGVEVSDRLTSGHVTQGYKNGGFKGALKGAKEALPKEKIEEILKSAGINGATAIAGGFAGVGIEGASQTYNMSKALKAFSFVASDAAIGAGAEYSQTGTITVEGTLFSVALSSTGQIVALKKLGKADKSTGKTEVKADVSENSSSQMVEAKKPNQVNVSDKPTTDSPKIKTAPTEVQTSETLSFFEFKAKKQELQKNPKLKQELANIKLTKNNISAVETYLKNPELHNNEDAIMILESIKNPVQKQLAEKILKNPEIYKNEYLLSESTYIIRVAENPLSGQCINKVLDNPKLNKSKNMVNKLGFEIQNLETIGTIKSKTEMLEKLELLNKLLDEPKLYNNEKIMNNFGDIARYMMEGDSKTKMNVMSSLVENPKISNNEKIMNELFNIIQTTYSEEHLLVKKHLLEELTSNPKLVNNKVVQDNIEKIILNVSTKEDAQMVLDNLSKSNMLAYPNLTHLLSNEPVSAQRLNAILAGFPLTDRNIGGLPEGWLNNVPQQQKAEASKKIYSTLADFAQKNTITKIEEGKLSKDLSDILGFKAECSFVDDGQFGKAYKVNIDGKDYCLKTFKQEKKHVNSAAHGSQIEVQSALYANSHSRDGQFTKFFFGKVASASDYDGFMVTEFLTQNKNKTIEYKKENPIVSSETVKVDFVTSGDVLAGHNTQNGKVFDFGAFKIDNQSLKNPRTRQNVRVIAERIYKNTYKDGSHDFTISENNIKILKDYAQKNMSANEYKEALEILMKSKELPEKISSELNKIYLEYSE